MSGFLKLRTFVETLVCGCVLVPQTMNKYSCEIKPELSVTGFGFLCTVDIANGFGLGNKVLPELLSEKTMVRLYKLFV